MNVPDNHYILVKEERIYNPKKKEDDTYLRINAQGAGALAVILAFIVALFTIAAIAGGVTSGCSLPEDDGEETTPPKPGTDCKETCEPGDDPSCVKCNNGALTEGASTSTSTSTTTGASSASTGAASTSASTSASAGPGGGEGGQSGVTSAEASTGQGGAEGGQGGGASEGGQGGQVVFCDEGQGGCPEDPCYAECSGPYASNEACEACNIGGN